MDNSRLRGRPRRLTLAIVPALVMLVTALTVLRAEGNAVVRWSPASASVDVGQTTTLGVVVENVSGLYVAEIHARFDPAILELLDADAGADGTQVEVGPLLQPDPPSQNRVDNAAGTIDFVVRQTPANAVTGAGVLFRATFKARAAGSSRLIFSGVLLAGGNVSSSGPVPVIASTTEEGSISVANPTPEVTGTPPTATASPTATPLPGYPGPGSQQPSPTPASIPTGAPYPAPAASPQPTVTGTSPASPSPSVTGGPVPSPTSRTPTAPAYPPVGAGQPTPSGPYPTSPAADASSPTANLPWLFGPLPGTATPYYPGPTASPSNPRLSPTSGPGTSPTALAASAAATPTSSGLPPAAAGVAKDSLLPAAAGPFEAPGEKESLPTSISVVVLGSASLVVLAIVLRGRKTE